MVDQDSRKWREVAEHQADQFPDLFADRTEQENVDELDELLGHLRRAMREYEALPLRGEDAKRGKLAQRLWHYSKQIDMMLCDGHAWPTDWRVGRDCPAPPVSRFRRRRFLLLRSLGRR